jgi:chemotaxis protein methyltransferase CheR
MSAKRHRLAEAVAGWTGIDLERGGRHVAVDHFVDNRSALLGLSVDDYIASLDSAEHPEVKALLEAVTVGHTWFYRDPEQLELISKLASTELPRTQPVSVWVPGCATGEDVFTLAMLAERDGWKASLLGTDINAGFVERAQAGIYGAWSVRELPPHLRANLQETADGLWRVPPRLKAAVSFRRHNLLDAPPPAPRGAWNVILCRNVLIYFRARESKRTVERLGRALSPGGWLFLGATDVITAPGSLRQIPLQGRSGLKRAGRSRRPPAPVHSAATRTGPRDESAAPPTRDDLLRRGVAALERGRTAESLALLIKALELDPLCAEGHLCTGIAYHLAGDPVSALQALRAAVLLEPELWLASFYLALSYEKLGRAREAKREFGIVAHALSHPARVTRHTLLSDKLSIWEKDIAGFARTRAR